jgi:hypothetical protein
MAKIKNYFKDINNTLTFIFLLLICVAGFILRVRNLGYLSFWGDDGHTFIGTISILKHGYPRLPSGYILWHGIFDYYLKALPVLILGAKEFSFRIVSVLSGIGTVIVSYFIGKVIANKFIGFLSAIVLSFSTWYIQFSREARYYSDFQFLFSLTFLFFYLGFILNKKPFKILTVIFMVLTSLDHGVGVMLIFLFLALLILKGKKFFKKEIIIPIAVVIFLDLLQIINQVFFWKVGRSFYVRGTGAKAFLNAYFKLPDPFYFKIINIMFPKMFYVFLAGIIIFIIFIIYLSIKKKNDAQELYLNEIVVKWGNFRWPFNLFLIYFTFIIIAVSLSLGQMYGQQRYIYFLMPIFILCFSYVIYLISVTIGKVLLNIVKNKNKQENSQKKSFYISTIIIFIIISALLVNGINISEAWKLAYKKHNEKVNIMYSISNSWDTHWDAAAGGKYVAQHMQPDDIVITTDIYNSPPYTGKVNYWLWTGNLISWAPYHDEDGKVIDDTYGVEVLRSLMAFVNVLNENTDKNIWILTNKSLYIKDHVDPSIKKLLDNYSQNLVLIARDDVSRLYYFPKTNESQRIKLENVFNPSDENIIKMQDKDLINFDFSNKNAQKYFIYGFSNVEENYGTWAIGSTSILFLNIGNLDNDYEFLIKAKPLDNKQERQEIELIINGNNIGSFEFAQSDYFSLFSFKVPKNVLKQGINDIVFKYKYSTKPKDLNISNDTRQLSVLFKEMQIKKE